MIGKEVENGLKKDRLLYSATDREVDITEKDSIEAFVHQNNWKNIDWIINCAGYTAVDRAEDESELTFRINADGVLNITEIVESLKAKLIHISTDYVFNGKKESCYTEEDEPDPISVYGRSKWEGEKNILRNLTRFFIIRTSWLYGHRGKSFVYTMLRLFKEKNIVKVVSDQFGSPTYAGDLASVIISIVKKRTNAYGIYHFANEGRTCWSDFAKEIYLNARRVGLIEKEVKIIPISTEEYPTKAKRPRNSYLSKDKIKRNFGIPIRSWQVALEEFFEEKVC